MDKSIPAPAAKILLLIGQTEAHGSYETIYGHNEDKLPKPLTQMTLDEVTAAQPGWTKRFGSSAAGIYQDMRDTLDKPGTLADVKGEMGLTGAELFDADLQDRIGFHLLKRRGYEKFMAGKMTPVRFALGLAQEWASFPVLAPVKGQKRRVERGQSYYAGDGVNHALIPPERVEALLASIAPKAPVAAEPAVPLGPMASHQAEVLQPTGPAPTGLLGRLKWLFVKPADPAAAVPVTSPTKGDPTIYRVQQQLRALGYYITGFVDGIDGRRTRDAVASARKDNGLGDGGIDAAFLTALPSFPQRPVSVARAKVGWRQAAEHAPELFGPNSTLMKAGAGLILGGGAGTMVDRASSTLDSVGSTVDRVGGYLDKAEGWATTIGTVVNFGVAHWPWIAGVLGLYFGFKGLVGFLDGVARIKAGLR